MKDLVGKLPTEVNTMGQGEEGPLLIPNGRGKFVGGWGTVEIGMGNNP